MTHDIWGPVTELMDMQRTLVLATADPQPWCAPVYFVYMKQRFYFFSSPKSRHIIATEESRRCAASIYRDGDSYRDIEGLQMDGRTEKIGLGAEAFGAFTLYLKKFPTVQDFFVDTAFDFSQFIDRFRTQLYAFVPEHVFYLNNEAGLAKRQKIELPL